jgi:uncharacterized protein (TIGR03435 family)
MLMIPRFLVIITLATQALLSTANAQARFEVASIHPSRPDAGPHNTVLFLKGDRFDAEAATVNDILDKVNDTQLFRVVGGPAWMRTDRYDIHAKADAPIPSEQLKDAVLALLAERFHLVVHYETRDVLATILTAPKRPAELKPAADGEIGSMRPIGHGDFVFTAVPMKYLASLLAQIWASPVVDQTGLTGSFDFTLAPSAVNPAPGMVYGDLVRESLLAFGFKVETRKVPLQITVVDRCERPSEN